MDHFHIRLSNVYPMILVFFLTLFKVKLYKMSSGRISLTGIYICLHGRIAMPMGLSLWGRLRMAGVCLCIEGYLLLAGHLYIGGYLSLEI